MDEKSSLQSGSLCRIQLRVLLRRERRKNRLLLLKLHEQSLLKHCVLTASRGEPAKTTNREVGLTPAT